MKSSLALAVVVPRVAKHARESIELELVDG